MVDISRGRQLFFDNHLVQSAVGLTREHGVFSQLDTPVLSATKPWEDVGTPYAATLPFSEGVVWDPIAKNFRCYYMAGLVNERHTALATSNNGVTWTKSSYNVVPDTNIVMPHAIKPGTGAKRDTQSITRVNRGLWVLSRTFGGAGSQTGEIYVSSNGINWKLFPSIIPPVGDRTTLCLDPFLMKWIWSIRAGGEPGTPRYRKYVCGPNIIPNDWSPQFMCAADSLDATLYDGGPAPQMYALDIHPYESLLVGLFGIWRGDFPDRPKHVDICLGYSRNGVSWWRESRMPVVFPSGIAGTWNYGNVQPAGLATLGHSVGIAFSARKGIPNTDQHGECSMGVAFTRRDGLAYVVGDGSLTTVPVTFDALRKYLFINATGRVTVDGIASDGRTFKNVVAPFEGDSTRAYLAMTVAPDFNAAQPYMPIQLRFHVKGSLYAFWISRDLEGSSDGYINGPEF